MIYFLVEIQGRGGSSFFILQAANVINHVLKNNNIPYISNFLEFSKTVNNQINFDILSKLSTCVFNPFGINAGFIIFKNSNIIKDFLKDCRKYHPIFSNGLQDQDCMSYLIQMKKYKNIYKIFDIGFQGNTELKNQSEFCYNEDMNFICHNYGQSFDSRIKSLINVKNNKWWKSIFKN